jgi:DNA-binding NtrC family response regulator
MGGPPAALRLLIVDDEPSVLAVFRLVLEERPWQIETCGSAEEALPRVLGGAFDLLITDKNLPGMSGVDLIRAVRERDRELSIVMITGYASSESAMLGLNLGIDAYLEKPFIDVYEVVRTLDRVLEQRTRRLSPTSGEAMQPPGIDVLVLSSDRRLRVVVTGESPQDHIDYAVPDAAPQAIRTRRPDLVIIDVRSFDGDLLALIAAIKEHVPEAACALLSDRVRLPRLKQLIELRVRAFIDSPLGSDACAAALRQLVSATRERKLVRRLFSGSGTRPDVRS